MNQMFNILKSVLIIVFILLISTTSSLSHNQQKFFNSSQGGKYTTKLISDKEESFTISFKLNELKLIEVQTDEGLEYLVTSPKAPNILDKGKPDLFYLTSSIIIPDRGNMQLEVIPGDYEEIKGIEIAPSKGNLTRDINPVSVPYVKGAVYNKDEFFPRNLASIRDPYVLRDFRGQTVDVFPVQYNPVSKTLRIYHEITVIVQKSNALGINEFNRSKALQTLEKEFSEVYKKMFLNYNHTKYSVLSEEGELLIIAHDDFMDAMQPFVNWKRTIGRKTTIVAKSSIGSTSDEIKSFISNFYNNPQNNLGYVLFVGDAPQIPTVKLATGDSDNAYAYIDGNDSYNEIIVGRFSAETVEHVNTQVQRMIHYERDINIEDTWLSNGMGIARNEGDGNGHYGEADYVHIDFIRDTLLNYTYSLVHQEYDGDVPDISNTSAAKISERINEGVSLINYCNHGSVNSWSVAGYNSSHVSALTNTGKLPFIWSVACVNGDFVSNYCFAEAWLRATHNGEPAGAIGTMMSTINQPWQPPMTGQDEMVGILSESFNDNIKRTFGGTSINGSLKMLDIHGSSGREAHDTWALFGDPTLMMRTDAPREMEVYYKPSIVIGSTFFEVNCNIEDAIAAISYTDDLGEVHLLSSSKVVRGIALLEFDQPLTITSNLTLAVIANNMETYIGEITFAYRDEPFVVLKSFQTSSSPNYGEEIGIHLGLQNFAQQPYTVTNVSAQISSDSPYVNITQNTASFGSIEPEQEINLQWAFSLEIANNIPDQTPVDFVITMSGEYEAEVFQWVQNASIIANAPLFKIGEIAINDDGQGLPGILDSGETVNAIIEISNIGHAASSEANIILTSNSEFINVNGDSNIIIDELPVGGNTIVSYSISAKEDTPPETSILLNILIVSGELETTTDLEIIVSHTPVYLMSNNSINACYGLFYDSGGPNGNYKNNESYTFTVHPLYEDTNVKVTFMAFDVEENDDCSWDKLSIYDGPDTISPLLGSYCGTVPPESISATNGPLTFYFKSDEFVTETGWEALLTCASSTQIVTFSVSDTQGQPIDEVKISVADEEFITNSQGVGSVEVLTNQTYEWTAEKSGYNKITGNIEMLDEPLSVYITMNYAHNVTFSVINTHGVAIAEAEINLDGYGSQITDDSGETQFMDVLANSQVTYFVTHLDTHPHEGVVSIAEADVFEEITMILLTSEELLVSDAMIYPNPFADNLTIISSFKLNRAEITSIIGQHIITLDLNGTEEFTVNTSKLNTGVYLIKLVGQLGEVKVRKIIKK